MFEQGSIRPPNEASSLLIRVTRNCPWNRCHICPPYKGKKFSRRPVDEVKRDIEMMAETFDNGVRQYTAAFLQDADRLILPTEELVEIMAYIKKLFPSIESISISPSEAEMIAARKKGWLRNSQEKNVLLCLQGILHTAHRVYIRCSLRVSI